MTISEWGQFLETLAARIGLQWPWLRVETKGEWATMHLSAEGCSASVAIEPTGKRDVLEVSVQMGSSSCCSGHISAARVYVHDLTAVVDAAIFAEGATSEVQVWARNCPCSYCGGRGWTHSKYSPCGRCEGSGLRDPADRAAVAAVAEDQP